LAPHEPYGEKVDKADIFGWTILYRAVTQRKRSVVDVLLAAGADTNIQNIKGRTVLHLAVDQRDGSLIDALLEAGADMNIQDEGGRTALHLAVKQSNMSLIDALLDAGADGNIQDKEGRTPLHFAAQMFQKTTGEMVSLKPAVMPFNPASVRDWSLSLIGALIVTLCAWLIERVVALAYNWAFK
tara:strand:+ start:1021 stop:1572 length:552 start_codon:yes stop_codon:yes gene_type:complete